MKIYLDLNHLLKKKKKHSFPIELFDPLVKSPLTLNVNSQFDSFDLDACLC